MLGSMNPRPAHREDLVGGRRDQLLTVEQAGEYLGTGERFIRRLITERRISYVKVGKYVRLERSALEALVHASRVHSQG
jgi:excisionase family DNA binding protein